MLDPGGGTLSGGAQGIAGLPCEILERCGEVEERIDGRGDELPGDIRAAVLDQSLALKILAEVLDETTTCLSGQERAEGAFAVGALGVEVVGEPLSALGHPGRVEEARRGRDLDRPQLIVGEADEARRRAGVRVLRRVGIEGPLDVDDAVELIDDDAVAHGISSTSLISSSSSML